MLLKLFPDGIYLDGLLAKVYVENKNMLIVWNAMYTKLKEQLSLCSLWTDITAEIYFLVCKKNK